MSKDDLFNELAGKLAGTKLQEDKNYSVLIDEIKQLGAQGQEKLTTELTRITNHAHSLESNSKWREASLSYYSGLMISLTFSPDDYTIPTQWVSKTANCLVKLSQDYMTWKEIDRAAAAISIGSILYFLVNDWEIKPFYNEFVEQFKHQIQLGKTASQSLWVPYHLVQSVNELNPEFLQQAESFSQSALLTETKISEAYREGIQLAISNARGAMISQMKVPNIQPSVNLPKDLVFGEKFSFEITLTNLGEGEARDVNLLIKFPTDFEILKGNVETTKKSLSPKQSHTTKIEVKSSKNGDNKKYDIQGKISYLDTIQNLREFPIGPYQIEIGSFRKSDDLKEKLKSLEEDLNPILNKLNDQQTTQEIATGFKSAFIQHFEDSRKSIHRSIDKNKFDQTDAQLELTRQSLDLLGPKSLNLISSHENMTHQIREKKMSFDEIMKSCTKQIQETEKKINEFSQKWLN